MLTGSFPLFDLFFSFPNSSPFSEALSFQVPQFGISPQEEELASPQAFLGSVRAVRAVSLHCSVEAAPEWDGEGLAPGSGA